MPCDCPSISIKPLNVSNGLMEIDGQPECLVTEFSVNVNNGHAARFTVGCAESQDPMVGQSVVDGSITAYFETMDLYKKFIEETKLTLKLTLADSLGNKLIIYLPNLHVGSGTQPDVTGDGSITIPINFTGHKDETEGTHVVATSVEKTP